MKPRVASIELPVTFTRTARRRARPAFSLTELLIVIGLLALMLTLSIPAFRFITGSRQTDAAFNVVSAVLGQARAEAIGLQETRGVFFYRKFGRIYAIQVRETPRIVGRLGVTDPNSDPVDTLFLDLVPDHEAAGFPSKVGVQLVNNTAGGTTLNFDRYIGFNRANTTSTGTPNRVPGPSAVNAVVAGFQYGGVILFRGNGQLVSEPYGFRCTVRDNTGAPLASGALGGYTKMGELIYGKIEGDGYVPDDYDVLPVGNVRGSNPNLTALRSQLGFVLYDEVLAEPAGIAEGEQDVQVNSVLPTDEDTRELWMDANSTPWVVNRMTGALVRGE